LILYLFIFPQIPKITLEQDSFIRRQSHLSDFEQIFFADFEGSASQEHFKNRFFYFKN